MRALRVSRVFLKVTNGFRVEWGAELYGGVRTVVATGCRQELTGLAALRATLEEGRILASPPAPSAESPAQGGDTHPTTPSRQRVLGGRWAITHALPSSKWKTLR